MARALNSQEFLELLRNKGNKITVTVSQGKPEVTPPIAEAPVVTPVVECSSAGEVSEALEAPVVNENEVPPAMPDGVVGVSVAAAKVDESKVEEVMPEKAPSEKVTEVMPTKKSKKSKKIED